MMGRKMSAGRIGVASDRPTAVTAAIYILWTQSVLATGAFVVAVSNWGGVTDRFGVPVTVEWTLFYLGILPIGAAAFAACAIGLSRRDIRARWSAMVVETFVVLPLFLATPESRGGVAGLAAIVTVVCLAQGSVRKWLLPADAANALADQDSSTVTPRT